MRFVTITAIQNGYEKETIVKRCGASRLEETKARAVTLVEVRAREGSLGGSGGDGTVSAGHTSSKLLSNSAAAVAKTERAGANADHGAVVSAGSAVIASGRSARSSRGDRRSGSDGCSGCNWLGSSGRRSGGRRGCTGGEDTWNRGNGRGRSDGSGGVTGSG